MGEGNGVCELRKELYELERKEVYTVKMSVPTGGISVSCGGRGTWME